uniref:Uncharacterized protein n=1 Tax=Anguilla anguilla TaxID=7936 RepID=A0A0E9XXM5_ANGAN
MRLSRNPLDQGVACSCGDAAVVLPVLGHVDVAFVTPVLTPAVLDNPELLSVNILALETVAHNQHPVVKLLAAAVLLIIDPGLVELEGFVTGVDGDGDGAHRGHGLHQGALLPAGQVHEAGVVGGVVLGVVVARLIVSSQVRVGLLGVQAAVVLDVLEGLVHEAAVAALVPFRPGALHQVLLAQRHQRARLPELLALHGASGAEGPAGTALTLVFHWSDVALLSPVNLARGLQEIGLQEHRPLGLPLCFALVTIHDLPELLVCHVAEMVHSQTVRMLSHGVLQVVQFNLFQVFLPNHSSPPFFLLVVLFTVPVLPLIPVVVQLWVQTWRREHGSKAECEGQYHKMHGDEVCDA